MDQLLEMLLENETRLISYEVHVDGHELKGGSNINKNMLKNVNKQTGITKEELLEIFEPAKNAMSYCAEKLAERINEGKK